MKSFAIALALKIVFVTSLTASAASYAAEQRSAVLDEADKQIASKLSFDPHAVAIARTASSAPFKIATINDQFWQSQPRTSHAEMNGWNAQSKANRLTGFVDVDKIKFGRYWITKLSYTRAASLIIT